MPSFPVVGWSTFLDAFAWDAGQHVTLLGKTGSGKSYLARIILQRRRFVVVLGSKPRDDSLKAFKADGFTRRVKWPPPNNHDEHVLLWPQTRSIEDLPELRDQFRACLDDVYSDGAWCVYADELPFIVQQLGLDDRLTLLWLQGRAMAVSVVASAQRPRWIPRAAMSEATHLFLWRLTDKDDLRRLAEIGGDQEKEAIIETVRKLPDHAFLYVNTVSGYACISRAPALR